MKYLSKILIFLSIFLSLPHSAAAASKTVTIESAASIKSVLELTVSQAENSELRFGNIRPSPTVTTEAGPIKISINLTCNTGQPYQVTQTISGPLENGSGGQISPDHLKFQSFSGKSIGTTVASPTPVTPSSQVIYVSDLQGTSDTVQTVYNLTVPPAQAPGDYSALLTYTASAV